MLESIKIWPLPCNRHHDLFVQVPACTQPELPYVWLWETENNQENRNKGYCGSTKVPENVVMNLRIVILKSIESVTSFISRMGRNSLQWWCSVFLNGMFKWSGWHK